MRQIDWDQELSEEDISWLRQSGMLDVEGRIERHQAKFGAEVPDGEVPEDTLTTSALDPLGRAKGEPVPSDGAPVNTTPEPGTVHAGDAIDLDDEGADDYDVWKVRELEAEVEARNKIADEREDVTTVEVVGTGTNGAIRKPDLIKGLRIWDDENPGILSETDDNN
jgi:hypothetical protein